MILDPTPIARDHRTSTASLSAREYRAWLTDAGLEAATEIVPTRIDCGALIATR